jgi:hypothetical protein
MRSSLNCAAGVSNFEDGMRVVANPGSTLGKAIDALIEREVHRLLHPIAEENGCVYRTAGPPNPRTRRPTKLILKDFADNRYNIDSVIANDRGQYPVLIESKYLRYKKQNRDKASWICTAHFYAAAGEPRTRLRRDALEWLYSRLPGGDDDKKINYGTRPLCLVFLPFWEMAGTGGASRE